MQQITSFSELYALANNNIRVFDLGRSLRSISQQDFLKIEMADIAHPHPYLQHAHIAIIAWQDETVDQHSIWLFKWGLDEQNKIKIAEHQTCLERVVKSLMTQDPNERRRLLQDHPFHFKPNDIMQACFHAHAAHILKRSTSGFLIKAEQYYLHNPNSDWQEIGIQGVAELVHQLDNQKTALLINNLARFSKQASLCLLACLENENIDLNLATALIKHYGDNDEDSELFSHLIRALSSVSNQEVIKSWLQSYINKENDIQLEILLAIASRVWPALDDDIVMINLFHKLAKHTSSTGVDVLAKDLISLDNLRPHVLKAIRVPFQNQAN